ncbi:hypothetical protein OsI_37134 [Oryza sativa Indica Group]|uniref:Uncharacterized protein n=1 Tax=Oryza sativa subsp. indica TaxID=39946 RepID=A2ZH73_ORYSI|nr:hypothetical protein OsI_37134 [Oryza sativa Indica Group]
MALRSVVVVPALAGGATSDEVAERPDSAARVELSSSLSPSPSPSPSYLQVARWSPQARPPSLSPVAPPQRAPPAPRCGPPLAPSRDAVRLCRLVGRRLCTSRPPRRLDNHPFRLKSSRGSWELCPQLWRGGIRAAAAASHVLPCRRRS